MFWNALFRLTFHGEQEPTVRWLSRPGAARSAVGLRPSLDSHLTVGKVAGMECKAKSRPTEPWEQTSEIHLNRRGTKKLFKPGPPRRFLSATEDASTAVF